MSFSEPGKRVKGTVGGLIMEKGAAGKEMAVIVRFEVPSFFIHTFLAPEGPEFCSTRDIPKSPP
jgi:hypothetical protein